MNIWQPNYDESPFRIIKDNLKVGYSSKYVSLLQENGTKYKILILVEYLIKRWLIIRMFLDILELSLLCSRKNEIRTCLSIPIIFIKLYTEAEENTLNGLSPSSYNYGSTPLIVYWKCQHLDIKIRKHATHACLVNKFRSSDVIMQ